MKRLLRSLSSLAGPVFIIALVVVSFRNVFWDDTEALAAQAACGGRPGCRAQMLREMHTPIAHTYRFVIAARQLEITCRRAYLLEGAYTCKEEGLAAMSALPETAPAASAPNPPGSAPKPRR